MCLDAPAAAVRNDPTNACLPRGPGILESEKRGWKLQREPEARPGHCLQVVAEPLRNAGLNMRVAVTLVVAAVAPALLQLHSPGVDLLGFHVGRLIRLGALTASEVCSPPCLLSMQSIAVPPCSMPCCCKCANIPSLHVPGSLPGSLMCRNFFGYATPAAVHAGCLKLLDCPASQCYLIAI